MRTLKKLFTLNLLISVLLGSSQGAWTNTQKTSAYPAIVATTTLAYPSNVTSGYLLATCLMEDQTGGNITLSKSSGTATIGAWNSFTRTTNTGAPLSSAQIQWTTVTGSGSLTLQASHTNADFAWHIYEFNPNGTGTITAESGQGTFQGNNVTSVATAATSSLTATDHDLLFSCGGTENAAETFTSIPLADGNTQQGGNASAACYQLDAGTLGNYTASWTVGTADTRLVWLEVAFKFVASGGGATPACTLSTLGVGTC